jgi:anti-anti-sigma regulatory factor
VSFELSIAVKRDPASAPISSEPHASTSSVCITVNGVLGSDAADAILLAVTDAAAKSADPILILMEDVRAEDSMGVDALAKGVMALRTKGVNVQVSAQQDECHALLARERDSRDWLIAFSDPPSSGPRRAVHVDGPKGNAPLGTS